MKQTEWTNETKKNAEQRKRKWSVRREENWMWVSWICVSVKSRADVNFATPTSHILINLESELAPPHPIINTSNSCFLVRLIGFLDFIDRRL